MKRLFATGLFAIGLLLVPAVLSAQPANGQPEADSAAASQPPQETLPELLVEPEQPPPTLPESLVEPEALDPSAALRGVYPSLSEQGGMLFDGGRRSGRSLLEEPSNNTIIDLRNLQERSPTDMLQALEREVGVMVQRTQRGAAAPFIRGLTGQRVLILVDGVRLNNATFRAGPNQYFNTIDPGMVDHIEVLRGPQSMLYGADAIGGVINVVTRGAANRFCCDYSSGQWIQRFSTADLGGYSRVNVEGSIGGAALFAGAGYGNFNNLDRGGDLGRQPWTDYSQYSGDLKFDYLLDPQHMLTFALQHFVQEDVARSDRFPSRQTIFDPQQRSLAYVRYQGADLSGPFDRFQLTASYHRQREGALDRRLATNNLDIGEFDTEQIGLSFLMSSDLGQLGRMTYGVDWYYDDVDSFKNRFDAASGALISARTPQFPDDGWYRQFGVFAEWDVDISDRLSAVSGLRYTSIQTAATPIINIDHDNNPVTPDIPTPTPIAASFAHWTPSTGLNYEITESLHLVGAISRGFRAPNLDDLAATNDNVQQAAADSPSINLRPEKSVSYDVGLKFNGDRLRGAAYYFWMDIDDMILRTPAGMAGPDTLFARTNRDSQINGFEMGGEYLLCGGWSAYGNMSYYLGEDLVRREPLSRIPPLQGVVGLRWRDASSRSFFDIHGWLVGRQDRLNFQDITDSRIPAGGTPGYGTLNLRLGVQLDERQMISVAVENLTDRAYRVHGSGVDGAGASATISYELNY